MANIFLKRDDSCIPKGWEHWAFVDNYVYGEGVTTESAPECDEFDVPNDKITLFNDAPFPKKYLPARAFWMESIISHCVFEWKFLKNVENGSGSDINDSYDCFEKDKHVYGIGIEPRDPVSNSDYTEIGAPEMGYCVGDVFKQHIYTHLRLEETIEDENSCPPYETTIRLYGTPTLQVLQNSRLKQIYVYEGFIKGYTEEKESDESVYYLDIGIDNIPSSVSGEITVYGKEGTSVLDIDGADKYGRLKVSQSEYPLKPGDYYIIDVPWCIQDPFLMSGFWLDNESNNSYNNSGLELYVTTHNSPYETGKFMGAYVWSDLDCPISSFDNMDDRGSNEWKFFWLSNTNNYFPNRDRFKETTDYPDPNVCSSVYKEQIKGYIEYEKREVASVYELEEFKNKNNFVRVEIQSGGDRNRHNWFAPALKDQCIKIDGYVYRIINHITSHIIDIATTSIDGHLLEINEYSTYEIINHKAWMIVEHFDGDEFECEEYSSSQSGADARWGKSSGLFEGDIYELAYDEDTNLTQVTLNVHGDHCGAWIKNAPPTDEFSGDPPPEWERYNTANNFINRYKQTHAHDSGEPIKHYTKFQDWKLVRLTSSDESCESLIQDFSIDSDYFNLSDHPSWPEAFNLYQIVFYIKGDASLELHEGDRCFVAFDDSFKTACCTKEGRYYLDFGSVLDPENASQSSCRNEGETAPLCIDGGYISNQYLINIPENYRIGYCEGKYWGVNGCATVTYDCYNNNSVFEDYGLYLHITTSPGEDKIKGIASEYSTLSRHDLVAYTDVNNQKLQLRVASSDFQSQVVKYEFAIGDLQTEDLSGSNDGYQLNTEYDRLNKIKFQTPQRACPPVLFTVCLGDGDYLCSTYGYSVGGRGAISLRPLKANNCNADMYVDFDGNPISPILIQPSTTTNLTKLVPLGSRTDVGKIKINDANGDVTGYYANDNQTIKKGMGFFDLLKISDGETYLIFNQNIGPFKSGDEYPLWGDEVDPATNTIENSKKKGNQWDKRSGVMMIGTYDGYQWNTPYVDINHLQPKKFLMILNAVEYLTSFYDELQRTFGVFVKCSNQKSYEESSWQGEEAEFIAFFSISYLKLGHKAYNMVPIEEDDLNSYSDEESCCNNYKYQEYNIEDATKREY